MPFYGRRSLWKSPWLWVSAKPSEDSIKLFFICFLRSTRIDTKTCLKSSALTSNYWKVISSVTFGSNYDSFDFNSYHSIIFRLNFWRLSVSQINCRAILWNFSRSHKILANFEFPKEPSIIERLFWTTLALMQFCLLFMRSIIRFKANDCYESLFWYFCSEKEI